MRKQLLQFPALCLLLITGAGRTMMADPPVAAYSPPETKVVILPVVNKAAEFNKDFQNKIQVSALHALTTAFSRRGFQVVDQKVVDTYLTENRLDLNDRENWRNATLSAIGKKLGSRLVIFCVVLDAHTKTNQNVFDPFGAGSKEGIANVRGYLIDVQTGEAILDKKQEEGKNTGGMLAEIDSGTSRESKAVVQGINKVLKGFFAAYPLPAKAKEGN